MFSGIVEAMGTVEDVKDKGGGRTLRVAAASLLIGDGPLRVADSVNVNGACLTVTAVEGSAFCADLTPETLGRTNLCDADVGDAVNLERALRLGDRVGGHIVQGHVDGVGTVEEVVEDGNSALVRVAAPRDIIAFTIEKGFVALDGVSLTCFNCDDRGFQFALIPFTAAHTTLGNGTVGTRLNIETDMTAKYVERLVSHWRRQTAN